MNDCPRKGKLFGGCKFSPRYDTIPPPELEASGSAGGLVMYAKALTQQLYVADVCERCGKTTTRTDTAGAPL